MSKLADKINDAIDLIGTAEGDEARTVALTEAKRLVEAEVDDLEAKASGNERNDGDVVDAVNGFLDEVERPVGTQSFVVPKTGAVDRALIRLHDSVGRM